MARHLIAADATIRAIKPGDPRRRLSDGDGLVLLLFVKGGAHGWRFDYYFGGKRNMLSLGTYPDTTLASARRKADAARQLLAERFDPAQKRKAEKAALQEARITETREQQGLPPVDSFEAVAREWFAVKQGGWAPSYAEKLSARRVRMEARASACRPAGRRHQPRTVGCAGSRRAYGRRPVGGARHADTHEELPLMQTLGCRSRSSDPDAASPPRRRFAQRAAIGLAALSAAACATTERVRPAGPTVVLVHGAWYGGWYWRKLVPLLAQAGCEVHTPTLTGLGDRAHLANRETTLQTHVQDLQALMQMNDLRDVVLVGHSYGGMVISQLAEREQARIRRLVYLDAFVPESGKSVIDYLLPLERRQAIVKLGSETGFVPPIPARALGVTDPADLAWIDARAVRQPFGTFNEPARLAAEAGAGLPRAYIACVEPASGSFGQFAERIRHRTDWAYSELRTGHNAMISAPALLARALLAP